MDNLAGGKYMDDGDRLVMAAKRLGAHASKTRFVYKDKSPPKTGEEKHMLDLLTSKKFEE